VSFLSLDLFERTVLILTSLVLFSSFALLAQTRNFPAIRMFSWQGALLAVVTALVALASGHHTLFVSALLTFVLKSMLIPWMLSKLVTHLDVGNQIETVKRPSLVLLGGVALTVFCYYVVQPIEMLSAFSTRNTLALAMAVVLLGMLMMITRRQAVSQVLGFMSIENGVFMAAVVSTHGMPLVVELGVAFDVLVAAVLFGVFFFHIKDSIESLDVDRLNRLAEGDDSAPRAGR
jgi:hydrogenase-4 component E